MFNPESSYERRAGADGRVARFSDRQRIKAQCIFGECLKVLYGSFHLLSLYQTPMGATRPMRGAGYLLDGAGFLVGAAEAVQVRLCEAVQTPVAGDTRCAHDAERKDEHDRVHAHCAGE